jgi:UDP-N-acetylmuramate dehydrogenase
VSTPAGVPGGADAAAVERALARLGDLGRPSQPIGPLTTYRVGGPAAIGVTVTAVDDLARVAAAAGELPVLVVGRGSNLLVAEAGFGGIAVILDADAFGGLAVDGTTVTAGGAVALPALARRATAAGVTGLEWAVGVPGSVGGGVRMNAGGHGSDIAASLITATVVDLATPGAGAEPRPGAALGLGYRSSALRSTDVVVEASFAGAPGDAEEGAGTIREIVRWRRKHQPGGQNAGSVFVNPTVPPAPDQPPRSAGWLIEQAGLKGRRIGTAEISPKHANFIQADPDGSADDVVALMRLVQHTVEDRWGIRLRTENRLIGFDNTQALQEG